MVNQGTGSARPIQHNNDEKNRKITNFFRILYIVLFSSAFCTFAIYALCTELPVIVKIVAILVTFLSFAIILIRLIFEKQGPGTVSTSINRGGGHYATVWAGEKYWGLPIAPPFTEKPIHHSAEIQSTQEKEMDLVTASKEAGTLHLEDEDKKVYEAKELHLDSSALVRYKIQFQISDHFLFIQRTGEFEDAISRIQSVCEATVANLCNQMMTTAMLLDKKYIDKILRPAVVAALNKFVDNGNKWGFKIIDVVIVGDIADDIKTILDNVSKAKIKAEEQRNLAEAAKAEAQGKKDAMLLIAEGEKGSRVKAAEAAAKEVEIATRALTKRLAAMKKATSKKVAEAYMIREQQLKALKDVDGLNIVTGSLGDLLASIAPTVLQRK
ncbi:MAG: hypothetical protein MUD00_01405 [Candidatus Pacebacteria bacterium]|jgi:regulator of protease activity HflC (stomatin/prohibitin superfamily)|nr:hypothetical protein [Candidatus Paceibacterota bacterium]